MKYGKHVLQTFSQISAQWGRLQYLAMIRIPLIGTKRPEIRTMCDDEARTQFSFTHQQIERRIEFFSLTK